MKKEYKILVYIIAISFVLKLVILALNTPLEPVGDEIAYTRYAGQLVDGNYRYDPISSYRVPIYKLYVAGFYKFVNTDEFPIKLGQVILSSLSVFIMFLITRRMFDEKTALISSGMFAFYPTLIAFTHFLWNETIFILFLLLFIYFLFRYRDNGKNIELIYSGIFIGLGSLTKGSLFYAIIAAFIFIYIKKGFKKAIIPSIILLITTLLVISPWTYQNYEKHNEIILLDTNSGHNLWLSNHDGEVPNFDSVDYYINSPKRDYFRLEVCALPSDYDAMKCGHEIGFKWIKENPVDFVKRGFIKQYNLWKPYTFIHRHYELGIYEASMFTQVMVKAITTLAYLAVLALGLIGMIKTGRDPRKTFFIIFILYYLALYSLFFGMSRFRLILMPIFMIYGSWFIVNRKNLKEEKNEKIQ